MEKSHSAIVIGMLLNHLSNMKKEKNVKLILFLKYELFLFLYRNLFGCQEVVLYEGCVHQRLFGIKNNNWGDDLNKHLFETATKSKFLAYPFSSLNRIEKHYLMVGSILNFYNLDNSIIYGSGIINPDEKITGKPNKVISVRGPKTRNILIDQGIDCPEVFGDPALLLPLIYKPSNNEKKYKYGIIYNMGTKKTESPIYKDLKRRKDILIISMTDYKNWESVIDKIVSCERIVSESLHGLIVAETYGIPNAWVTFKKHDKNWDFKFNDYYESIKKNEQCVLLSNIEDFIEVDNKLLEWKKGDINYEHLSSIFPFNKQGW